MRELPVFNSVFKIEKTVYSIQGIQLPIPISYRQFAFFVSTLALMIALNASPLMGDLLQNTPLLNRYLVKFVGIPMFVAWYFTRKTLDGKAPHRFFLRYLEYLVSPRIHRRYESVDTLRSGTRGFEGTVAFRSYERGEDR